MAHLISMPRVLMKILSHASAKKKQKGLQVSDFSLLLVVFKRRHGSGRVKKNRHWEIQQTNKQTNKRPWVLKFCVQQSVPVTTFTKADKGGNSAQSVTSQLFLFFTGIEGTSIMAASRSHSNSKQKGILCWYKSWHKNQMRKRKWTHTHTQALKKPQDGQKFGLKSF